MNLIKELGPLALGTRLKRLSDQIMKNGSKVYQAHHIDFDPKWFPVLYLLNQKSPLGIVDIAHTLGFSHPAVCQFINELEREGLVSSVKDKKDHRKRLIDLTPKSKALIVNMIPIWEDIIKAIQVMLCTHHHNILLALDEIETSFEEKNLLERVQEVSKKRQIGDVEIIDYMPQYKEYFKKLNYEWVNKYFEVEEIDKKIWDDPENMIIKEGGHIIFARSREGEIIGTCALINEGNKTYELSKMAVDEKARGKQVGKKLGLAIIEKAKELGAEKIVLLSNTELRPALNLYKKLGFKTIEWDHSEQPYARANIKMLLNLNK